MRISFAFVSLLLVVLVRPADAQLNPYPVSAAQDVRSAGSAAPLPGLRGGFRQQILVGAGRLSGLQSKQLTGIAFRRDLDYRGQQVGGRVDLQIRIGPGVAPASAQESFAANFVGASTTVFSGQVLVPTSPPLPTPVLPWATANTVAVTFSTPYGYSGGDLSIDIEGRPVAGSEPRFWYIDHELGSLGGTVTPIGVSCSEFRDVNGHSLYAESMSLQIGSTMRVAAHGRWTANPVLLAGPAAIPGGVDLAAAGAPGCRTYVQFFMTVPLAYSPPTQTLVHGRTEFMTQLPQDSGLLDARFYLQLADLELAGPRTNSAGLTTSNGLELRVAAAGPGLGMAVVTSKPVDGAAPMPARGRVDVEVAPVMRLSWR